MRRLDKQLMGAALTGAEVKALYQSSLQKKQERSSASRPFKPMALEMEGVRHVRGGLYERESDPGVFLNAQGMMLDEPECAACMDAHYGHVIIGGVRRLAICECVGREQPALPAG